MIGISGLNGFLGKAILKANNIKVIRSFGRSFVQNVEHVDFDLSKAAHLKDETLNGLDVFIHCAARVHVMGESGEGSLHKFRKVNVDGTLILAEKAAKAGVKRFIFISSIKVNGEETSAGAPFDYAQNALPKDPYGQSKSEAEVALRELSQETGMEVVIIRPPLVYGPGVKANFLKLLSWVDKGVPLPLGAIHNKRSMVGLDNLVDLVVTCIDSPKAANQTFLVSDNNDVSTTELIRSMAKALDRPARLIPVPEFCLKGLGSLMGKRDMINRLCDSLEVDIRHTMETLDWQPPHSIQDQLQKTADAFKQRIS